MKIELSKDQITLLEMGTKIPTSNGGKWYYLPYYYKHIEGNTFEEVTFEKLPEGIQKYINNQREKK